MTWRSQKQSIVGRSNIEAEFRVVAQQICELLWLKPVLEELKFSSGGLMKLYCDNKAAITHNPMHHNHIKHVEVDMHFIKEKIEKEIVSMSYVPTSEQVADLLTKVLEDQHSKNR